MLKAEVSKAEALSGSDRDHADRVPFTGLFLAMRDAWLPPGGQQSSIVADFVLLTGHAVMIGANRSASYWLGLAQILADHQAKSIRALGADGIDGSVAGSKLVAVDEVRALLREVGDLATREARLLQNEFGMLAESLAQNLQPSDPSGPYRRRWRSKV